MIGTKYGRARLIQGQYILVRVPGDAAEVYRGNLMWKDDIVRSIDIGAFEKGTVFCHTTTGQLYQLHEYTAYKLSAETKEILTRREEQGIIRIIAELAAKRAVRSRK